MEPPPKTIASRSLCRSALKLAGIAIGAIGIMQNNAVSGTAFPPYDHIFLIIEENHGFSQIIGNPAAPNINALANRYGLATAYFSTSAPSEPNYVAMLGGSDFGIADDGPYYVNIVDKPSLMSQLEAAGKAWKAYHQTMPYAGFRGLGYPNRIVGVPDLDLLYASKHNGMLNFKSIQTDAIERAKMMPLQQLSSDLANNRLFDFSYIVPDECHDMHGGPPNCVDSGNPGDVQENELIGAGDLFVGDIVNQITSASFWSSGNNAIVITFDEGNDGDTRGCCDAVPGTGKVATIVITNNGPRHFRDPTPYNHYSLLSTFQHAFGLGCLEFTCDTVNVEPMTPLFSTH
jgi:hypothetical protein